MLWNGFDSISFVFAFFEGHILEGVIQKRRAKAFFRQLDTRLNSFVAAFTNIDVGEGLEREINLVGHVNGVGGSAQQSRPSAGRQNSVVKSNFVARPFLRCQCCAGDADGIRREGHRERAQVV